MVIGYIGVSAVSFHLGKCQGGLNSHKYTQEAKRISCDASSYEEQETLTQALNNKAFTHILSHSKFSRHSSSPGSRHHIPILHLSSKLHDSDRNPDLIPGKGHHIFLLLLFKSSRNPAQHPSQFSRTRISSHVYTYIHFLSKRNEANKQDLKLLLLASGQYEERGELPR